MPPYEWIAADLRRRIEGGELRGKLPSVRVLKDRYGVSSNTVRKALGVLRDEGLVRSQQGWGTWVARRE